MTGRIARGDLDDADGAPDLRRSHPDELEVILDQLAAAGVHNVLALRGDPAEGRGTPWKSTDGGLEYASELVELIQRQHGRGGRGGGFPRGAPDAA